MGPIAKLKQQIVSQLLGELDYVLLVVDPRCPGVILPAEVVEPGQPVGLHVGFRVAVPIPDLQLTDDGVTGTLSFHRAPFHCTLPWASVLQVSVGDEHLLWLAPLSADESEPRNRCKLRLV